MELTTEINKLKEKFEVSQSQTDEVNVKNEFDEEK